mgnify:CR=1 FL=1
MREFLELPGTMAQIDAALVLRQVRNLRLPFERLVRNVWQEGPEVRVRGQLGIRALGTP